MDWLIALLIAAIGTYLMRIIPFSLALTRRGSAAQAAEEGLGARILALASPAIITALLVVAVVPPWPETDTAELLRRGAGLAAAALAHSRRANLALAVLAGLLAYAVLKI
ncbi:MAG TPA: AzlD domain-containing protein [Sphingobacteriaceae bacterium]|nr:AzlD domain-containing protein [Sphingobacteriaceae bacterium]